MNVLASLSESYWLWFQSAATALYVLLTVGGFKTKKQNRVTGSAISLLLLLALFAPFVSLAQPYFWWFLLSTLLLWAALFWYEGSLAYATQENNPGVIALLIPCMALVFTVSLAVVMHLLMSKSE